MKPLFLPTDVGPLFSLYFPPISQTVKRAILHVPTFAEEMNKSRHMVTLQARAFAEQGYAVLILDLFGTGDSAGDFGDATWQIWLQNISDAIAWLSQQGAQATTLWSLRLGALLAMDFCHHNSGLIDRLLLWQPVLNGDVFITQFLRLRVAAAMMNSALPQEKTSDLKKKLLDGQSLEVAGYALHPDLVRPLLGLKTDGMAFQSLIEVVIFELVAGEEIEPTMVNKQFLVKLQALGINASLDSVLGDFFWASQEIATAPNLIELTSKKASQWLLVAKSDI
jgi:exosortase A-associated hydrolase 2